MSRRDEFIQPQNEPKREDNNSNDNIDLISSEDEESKEEPRNLKPRELTYHKSKGQIDCSNYIDLWENQNKKT